MAALSDDVKAFIVKALACFDTPSSVAQQVKEEFGLVVTRQQVATYHPERHVGRNLSEKWRELFAVTREAFRTDLSSIPIANQAARLRRLNMMADRAMDRGNMQLAAQLIEQASKEVGGAFTNRHKMEHTGKDGAPIESKTTVVNEDDVKAALRRVESNY